MRSTGWVVAAALAAAAGCGSGDADEPVLRPAGEEAPPPGELPPGVSADVAAEGRRLYMAACVMCHGERGEGTQLGPALATGEWARGSGTFEEIVEVVTEGAPAREDPHVPMPARGGGAMSDEEIRAVSAYAYSLSRARTAPADTSAAE